MNNDETILLTLGEIKGEIKSAVAMIPKLHERVSKLEMWQHWMKGGCAAIASAVVWKLIFGR